MHLSGLDTALGGSCRSRFLADPDVETVDFDGCDFGMQDKDGVPIRKQWKVATTSKELIEELSGRKCKHEKGYLHARIEGSVTPCNV